MLSSQNIISQTSDDCYWWQQQGIAVAKNYLTANPDCHIRFDYEYLCYDVHTPLATQLIKRINDRQIDEAGDTVAYLSAVPLAIFAGLLTDVEVGYLYADKYFFEEEVMKARWKFYGFLTAFHERSHNKEE